MPVLLSLQPNVELDNFNANLTLYTNGDLVTISNIDGAGPAYIEWSNVNTTLEFTSELFYRQNWLASYDYLNNIIITYNITFTYSESECIFSIELGCGFIVCKMFDKRSPMKF